MGLKGKTEIKAITSLGLAETFTDFILSRQAMLCSGGTIRLYRVNLSKFISWLKTHEITRPEEIQSRHVRLYLSELASRNLSDSYINCYARNIKTLLRFFYSEHYIPSMISFEMPKVGKKRLPYLQAEQLPKILQACETTRDKSLILCMIDSGLRRAELCALNWGDVNIQTGVIIVRKGKGNKTRNVVIGVKSRRVLLSYSREVNHTEHDPLFQTYSGTRLTGSGLRSLILRIGNRAGIKVSPHGLRRTFATLSLKAGMSLVHIQGLMGHSSIEMTRDYIQTISDDYIEAHHEHSPIDNFM